MHRSDRLPENGFDAVTTMAVAAPTLGVGRVAGTFGSQYLRTYEGAYKGS
jgi:hypothetical protein